MTPMTDQPSTQEGDVSYFSAGVPPEPTTQEAEEALETLAEMKHDLAHGMSVQGYRDDTMERLLGDFDAALRALRTQLTEQQAEIEQLRLFNLEYIRAERDALQLRHTKDQERIEQLEREQVGVQKWVADRHKHLNTIEALRSLLKQFSRNAAKDQERIAQLERALDDC